MQSAWHMKHRTNQITREYNKFISKFVLTPGVNKTIHKSITKAAIYTLSLCCKSGRSKKRRTIGFSGLPLWGRSYIFTRVSVTQCVSRLSQPWVVVVVVPGEFTTWMHSFVFACSCRWQVVQTADTDTQDWRVILETFCFLMHKLSPDVEKQANR